MEEIKRALRSIIDAVEANPNASEQELNEAESIIRALTAKLEQTPLTVPRGAEFLYALADGNQGAFVNYARQFPDSALNAMAKDPRQLQEVFRQLQSRITLPTGQVADGVPKAPLQSSNVYGFQYDPRTQQLKVRFQEGGVYEYDDVEPIIFKIFKDGAIPAKTTGQNRFGFWFRHKKPSLGASFYELIRKGGYNYRKVA